MFTNRRPYYGLKMSTTDFFREPVRFLKESNTQESMMEKPYLEDEYPKMHLKLPDFKFKLREIPSIFGPIANGDPYPGLAMIDFGDANCGWNITNVSECIEGPIMITMWADYLWHAEFDFVAGIASDSIGTWLTKLGGTTATSRDKQNYLLTFPKNANGSVTICGFTSTYTLVSQTFETVVAGMPVGIHLINGALVPVERGQDKPATLLKSVYGDKGDDCGCITISSNCTPACNCNGMSIGYTTRTMQPETQQTLSVLGAVDGCTYDWEFKPDSGGSLSAFTGVAVTYTAPEENVNCDNNAGIMLKVNGNLCDIFYVATNMPSQTGLAYQDYSASSTCVGGYCKKYVSYYTCLDTFSHSTFQSCIPGGWIACGDNDGCGGCETGIIDIRSAAQKEAGCCPAGLIEE
jgi:hypothetical protein